MYKHILLALDGSPIAEQAIPYAVELTKGLGSKLTLMSCVEPYVIALPATPTLVPSYNIDTDVEALVKDREDYLQNIRNKLAAEGLAVDIILRQGRAADEILDAAKEEGVSIIIMTTHGRSGLSRFIYGSVAERVLHSAEVPVLMVRAKPIPGEAPGAR